MASKLRRYIREVILEGSSKFTLKDAMGQEILPKHDHRKMPSSWGQFPVHGVIKTNRSGQVYYKITVEGQTIEGQSSGLGLQAILDDLGPFANAMHGRHRGIPGWFREPQLQYNWSLGNIRVFEV